MGYRETCFQYYDSECCVCGNGKVDVHHIDGDRDNNSSPNLVPLCRQHHCLVTIYTTTHVDFEVEFESDILNWLIQQGRSAYEKRRKRYERARGHFEARDDLSFPEELMGQYGYDHVSWMEKQIQNRQTSD